jgi:hypothetical protein
VAQAFIIHLIFTATFGKSLATVFLCYVLVTVFVAVTFSIAGTNLIQNWKFNALKDFYK